MKLKQLSWVAAGLLAGSPTLLAKPAIVNDGKKLTKLAKIENTLNEGGAEIDLTVVMRNQGRWPIGYLVMTQAGNYANPALCAGWLSDRYHPGTVEYAVTAEVQPIGAEDVFDGVPGIIGWLDSESGVGISFALNHYDGFQVSIVSFQTDDADANRSLVGLFNLDGSPAQANTDSAWSGKGAHDPSKFITMRLAFSAPTEEDKAALEGVTARLTATAFKSSKKIIEGTREIVLLTNLPVPEGSQHRFGYFGYWDSIWDEGSEIGFFKNLKFDGKLYNYLPTLEPIDDLTLNEDETGEVVALIDDVELHSSKLEVSAESSDPALVPVEGISISPSGSKRTLTITPSTNAYGEAIITLTVSDGTDQVSGEFTVTVNALNDPPTIEPIDDLTVNEDGTLGDVVIVVADAESASSELEVSAESSNPALLPVEGIAISLADTGRALTLTPSANAHGKVVISLTVSDGESTGSTAVTLNVNAVNDPPTLAPVEAQKTKEDQPVSVTVSLGDVDTAAAGLKLTGVAAVQTLLPTGNIVVTGDGLTRTVTLVPAENMNGKTSVTLSVSDGEHTASVEFDLAVISVADDPVALPLKLINKYGESIDITLKGTDPDGLGLTFQILEMPEHGSITGDAPNLNYKPDRGFYGRDTLQFRVVAGGQASKPVTVVIITELLDKGEPPILTIVRLADGKLRASWDGEGGLQSSTDLKNWQEVGEAANPFVIDPSDSWNFFRVIER